MEKHTYTTYEIHNATKDGFEHNGYMSPDASYYIDGHYTLQSARNHMADLSVKHPKEKFCIVKNIQTNKYRIVN